MIKSVDKIGVLKAQLDSAIFLVTLESGFVAAHTIIMAAEELFRTLYVRKDLFVEFDYRFYIRDEHQAKYLQKTREKYNFFKHADRDIDSAIEVDDEQVHKLNELLLGILIAGYRKTFSGTTPAMDTYGLWFAAIYPDYIKWENLSGGIQMRDNLKKMDFDPPFRRQMLRVMLYQQNILPRDDFELLSIVSNA